MLWKGRRMFEKLVVLLFCIGGIWGQTTDVYEGCDPPNCFPPNCTPNNCPICCNSITFGSGICCGNVTLANACTNQGECICSGGHWGLSCRQQDNCGLFFNPLFTNRNCGLRGRCILNMTLPDLLVCDCDLGWGPIIPPTPHDPLVDLCNLESPCVANQTFCNRLECPGCQCIPDPSNTIYDIPTASFSYNLRNHFRLLHTCACNLNSTGFYNDRDLNETVIPTETCYRSLCLNNTGIANCSERFGAEPTYVCNPGYNGLSCLDADFCIIDNYDLVCQQAGDVNAICVRPARNRTDLQCRCSRGYNGTSCEIRDYCITDHANMSLTYCGNFGHCDPTLSNATQLVCACDPGYIGPQCVANVCSTGRDLCVHALNTTCVADLNVNNGYTCGNSTDANPACEVGWDTAKCNIEDRCETQRQCNSDPQACAGCCSPDRNNTLPGTDPPFLYYNSICACGTLYEGDVCQYPHKCNLAIANGQPIGNCSGHGQCNFTYTTEAMCTCNEGYFGDICAREDLCFQLNSTDPCNVAEDPGNFCDRERSFPPQDIFCVCVPGFNYVPSLPSLRCVRNPCFGVVCLFGGTPVAGTGVNATMCNCTCVVGFHGDRCEYQDLCIPNPCNGFGCNPINATFECDCPQNLYTPTCGVSDACGINPFLCDATPGSTPINQCVTGVNPGQYTCNCTLGWIPEPARPEPNCFRQDLCTDPVTGCNPAGTAECTFTPGDTLPTCTCRHPEYYFGPTCSTQDVCSNQVPVPYCSQLGTASCVNNTAVTANCTCNSGYHGDRCQLEDKCVGAPCLNNGTCQTLGNDYNCTCPPLYNTGDKNCTLVNGCVRDSPCQNGFPCTPQPNPNGTDDWSCACGPEYQLQPNCSQRDPCVLDNRCQNGGVCSREDDDRFNCTCVPGSGYVGQYCDNRVALIRTELFPGTANVGEPSLFILIVENPGTNPIFRIDFGDEFTFEFSEKSLLPLTAATVQENRGILGTEGIAALTQYIGMGFYFYPFTHLFKERGNYTVTSSVINAGLETGNHTNFVIADTRYCLPMVRLRNCGRSRDGRQDPNVPTYERKSRFVIESSLYYTDCQPDSGIKFAWNLFRLTEVAPYPRTDNEWEIDGITEHENGDEKHIIFLPYNLLQGEYWIQLFVYYDFQSDEENRPVGNLDWCYFNLKNSPPIARIEGGTARTVHLTNTANRQLILNASTSVDQNDPVNPRLTFEWTFKLVNDPAVYPCTTFSSSDCTAPWIQVDVERLTLNTLCSYTCHVDVRSVRPQEAITSASASQELTLVNEGLEVFVVCVENCLKFNPGETVHLECGCHDCGDGLSVTYTHTWNDAFGTVRKIGQHRYHLILGQNPGGQRLYFICSGTAPGVQPHRGQSSLPILINSPPVAGNCTLTQPQNITFVEELNSTQVGCSGFSDPEPSSDPLTYQLNAIIMSNGSGDEILPQGVLLLHDVYENLSIFYLPLGDGSNGYEVQITVDVFDAFGLPTNRNNSTIISTQVYPPGPGLSNLNVTQEALRTAMDTHFGYTTEQGSTLTRLTNAGDNQQALQLILSVLYTLRTFSGPGSDLEQFMGRIQIPERVNVSNRIMSAIRSIPLYSHLIVKQVMQSLYMLSYYAEFLSNETLLSCAEHLITTARYFRRYVIRNEEVINIEDIAQLARAGKSTAENIMTETANRGRILLDQDAAGANRQQQLELKHLYQIDRDYFLEVDELGEFGEGLISIEQPENTTLNPDEVETVKRMSSICERAFVSIIHLLEAIASREVLSTTSAITLPASSNSKVNSSVDVLPVSDLISQTLSGIVFPTEIVDLIEKQNADAVQLHYTISDIDPYFGDFGIRADTKILRVEMKVDGQNNDGQWIRVTETVEPIRIQIPFRNSSQNLIQETIQNTTETSTDFSTVELVPFEDISDLNPNIKMYHLSLIHGSTFYMVVTTRSEPLANYSSIEYQAALTQDYRPTDIDFCRQNTPDTRRFSSGEVIEFKIESAESPGNGGISEHSDYLDYYMGIWPFDENGTMGFGTSINLSVNFVQLSCLSRNEDADKWVGRGCEVSHFVDGEYLECACSHLSIFAGSVVVPPNSIDFADIVNLFLTIPDNYIVAIAVGSVLTIWLIGHFICLWKDRDDQLHHTGITIMCEIGENFSHTFYLVRVVTGSRISAGTTANVSIQIFGRNGRSKVYVIKDSTLSVLNRGGNDSFLISSAMDLGELEKLRVWHDNTGPRPGWYLRKIHVREIKSGKGWYFFADTWLSMTYEKDPNIIREFSAATDAELTSWRRRFGDRLVEEFNNSHLWFSLFFRLPSSSFTRCQRWVCSVGIVVTHMLFNIMWEGIPTTDISTLFEIGDFSINIRQFLLGLQIAIMSSPVGLLLILFFRRIRSHRIPTLVVWQDRIKRHTVLLPNVREEHIFLPDKHGEFKQTVIPAPISDSAEDFAQRPFAVPSTEQVAMESWISNDTRGFGLRPPSQREPDAFVHKVPTDKGATASHLLRIGRRALAQVIRRDNLTSFIYSGEGDFEAQFEEEIRSRAETHPWTELRKPDVQAIEAELKAELPKMKPVLVVPKEDREQDMIYHGISLDLCLMVPVYKRVLYFPWWFIYFSWAFAVATILTCAFFTVLYGLSIGRLRSWHWLTEISFSFVQTVVITQPVRILVMAIIFSVIDDKLHAFEDDRFQVIVKDGTEELPTNKKLVMEVFQPKRSYPPCSGATLLKLRLMARRRNELKRGIAAMFVHALAMVFLACIISNSSSDKFAVTSHLRNMLRLNENEGFENIKTSSEFYRYMNHFALMVNPVLDYNDIPVAPVGDARYESTLMADNETMILGIPRIRQVRTKTSECLIHPSVQRFYASLAAAPTDTERINCTPSYTSVSEELETFNPFWKPVIGNSRSWRSSNDVWIWRTPNTTKSIILSGKLSTYDAGGYMAELGMQYRKTVSVLNYLRQTNWIDSRTRAIFVEMSVIVPNVNIFADVLLMLELPPAGSYVPTARVLPLQITFPETIGASWRTWVLLCYISVAVYALGLLLSLGRGIAYHWLHYRMGFIGSLWLWLDFAIGASAFLAVALAFKFHVTTLAVQVRLDTSLVNEFINLQRIAYWDYMHISFFAVVFGLCMIKMWRFLILFRNRFYILALTLRLTSRFLVGFMFIIVILTTGFACWGFLAFGDIMPEFSSIGQAFLELKHQVLRNTFYNDLRSVHAAIGRIYYVLFSISLSIIAIQLFVALLASGFFEAKEIARQRRHRATYWSTVKNSTLFRWLCGSSRPLKDPEHKLPIPPIRLKAMEQSTRLFLRNCLESSGWTTMQEMFEFCNTRLLTGTGYKMVPKKEKAKRLRNSMNTTLEVSKYRLEEMRLKTIAHIRRRLNLDLSPEDEKAYAEFHLKLLELKVRKVRKVIGRLDRTLTNLWKELDHREAKAKAKWKAEAEKMVENESSTGWRPMSPDVTIPSRKKSSIFAVGDKNPEEPTQEIEPAQQKSPPPVLRRRTFF